MTTRPVKKIKDCFRCPSCHSYCTKPGRKGSAEFGQHDNDKQRYEDEPEIREHHCEKCPEIFYTQIKATK